MGRLVGGSKGKCMFSNHDVRIFKVRSWVGIGNERNIIKGFNDFKHDDD